MKKILKIIILVGLSIYIAIYVVLFAILIIPSFKDAEITFTDFFKKELEPEKHKRLKTILDNRSEELGRKAAFKYIKGLRKLFIPSGLSNIEREGDYEYPYPSFDEFMEEKEKDYQKSLDQSLKDLEEGY